MTKQTAVNKQHLLEIPSSCLDYNLRKASRIAAQHYEEVMKSCGLRNTQFSLLVATCLMDKPLITDLAHTLAMDRTTVSRNVKPLQRDGLLSIVPGVDKRSRHIVLTEAGRQRLLQAIPLWQKAHQSLQQKVGMENAQQLLTTLNTFANRLSGLHNHSG
ncbi:MAG: MarR family winged helix-turn-helix transcriptional regulator [Methylococcales bacterium]